MKPKLFQDVDGCLLVDAPVKGYSEFRAGSSHWYDQKTPERLRRLTQLFEVEWASNHWQGRESLLENLFGVGPLPSLAFRPEHGDPSSIMHPEKLAAIKMAYKSPSAIMDDKMGPAVQKWANGKFLLLIQPDPKVGLTEQQYRLLCSFGEQFQDGAAAPLLDSIWSRNSGVHELFGYGTFRNHAMLQKILKRSASYLRTDKVVGYVRRCGTLQMIDATGDHRRYCTLLENEAGVAEGDVIEVTDADIVKLDQWESHYERREVELLSGATAFAYFLTDGALTHWREGDLPSDGLLAGRTR